MGANPKALLIKINRLRNKTMRHSQKTIEIQASRAKIRGIPSVISEKAQENTDDTINGSSAVSISFLTDKGSGRRGLGVSAKSAPMISENCGFERKISQNNTFAGNCREFGRTDFWIYKCVSGPQSVFKCRITPRSSCVGI